MFDANACAIELLKMKSSEDYKKEVAASSKASSLAPEPVPMETLKPPDPVSLVTLAASIPSTTSTSIVQPQQFNLISTPSGENVTSSSVVPSSNSSNGSSINGVVTTAPSATVTPTVPVLVYAKKSSPFDVRPKPPFLPSQTTSETQKPAEKQAEESKSSSSSKPSQRQPTTSVMAPNVSSSSGTTPGTSSNSTASSSTPNLASVTEDDDAVTLDSSSDEEDDIFTQFSRENVGSSNNERVEEAVMKRNSNYLLQRCASLMQRLQGVMQLTTAKHVSAQLQAVIESPVFTNSSRTSNSHGRSQESHGITKQGLAEMQFGSKVMTNIIRHSMRHQLDPNDDSATDESDTDDDEVVLPDERMMDTSCNSSSECARYLPVENNPFIEAVKLEKQYEARRTSLEFNINECEYSLTKSLALRKHCKIRKPVFQLEKPSTSSNVINIPVDATSSVKFYHDSKPATMKRVSDMMNLRRSSLEQDKGKISNGDSMEVDVEPTTASTSKGESVNQTCTENKPTESSQESNSNINGKDVTKERNAFIPTIKSMGSDGVSVLGVEFVNNSDPNQSASRCAAIKRPDKNRKVFQLGGIQNIFRDANRLPTVRCSCFGRDELCALCLGRAKKKAEINHVYMSDKEKLSILDEGFHKTLSFPEDVSLEVLLAASAVGNNNQNKNHNHMTLTKPVSDVQQLIKNRSQHFPPDLLHTGVRPKRPRSYDIKPYVETPVRSPKKDSRYSEETAQSPRKRPSARKSQSSFEDRELTEYHEKGWPSRERKDSIRRTRNQEFDIDNIVIPYSMAATTRVEQLVYKPIETPRWRVLDYSEIFSSIGDNSDEEMEDMSNAAFLHRHNNCEVEEKMRFTVQKAPNFTRKTRRLDSTCRSESDTMGGIGNDENSSSSHPIVITLSPDKSKDKEVCTPILANFNSTGASDGSTTPVTDTSTVITEAMANQALKSLFKVGNRRRTISTSTKMEEVDEESTPAVVLENFLYIEPWPERKFPLSDEVYKEMLESMEQSFLESSMDFTSHHDLSHLEDSPLSPTCLL